MSLNTAEQLEENEQYDKAYEEYKKMHAQKPKSIEILERLGHLATMLDKKSEAEEYYNKILELDATSVLAYEQLMDIYIHTNSYRYYISRGNLHVVQQELSHAINDFKKALDKAQSHEETNSTRFVLANLYEQTGKNHQAIDEYLRILDTGSVNEFVYLKLAQIYLNEDSVISAIETLERARENNFDTDNVKENLAKLYLKNNQPDKARELTKDDLVRTKSFLEEGANQAAFEILDKIKEDYKKNAQYHLLLAQYYFNVKNWEKSLESVNEFDKFEKNSPLNYQMRALIFEEQGNDFDAHINWAKYNLARKDRDVALNEYFSAYQVKADDGDLLRNIAELLEDTGDKNQASEFWERLVNLEPSNRKALEKLADFKENIGDYGSEAEILEKLYSIDNKNAAVTKRLAGIYEKIKNKDKALEFYNKFVSMSPVNEEYEKAKAKIKKLESTEFEEDEGLLGKIMKLIIKN
ncbi:MAG: hypothetical protein WCY19_07690 [Candidatus Gastranaerophilaceae bacterium]